MQGIIKSAVAFTLLAITSTFTLPAPVPVGDHLSRLTEEWDVQFSELQDQVSGWHADGIMGFNRLSQFAYDQHSLIHQSDRRRIGTPVPERRVAVFLKG